MMGEGGSKSEVREIFRREEKSLCQVVNQKRNIVENIKLSLCGILCAEYQLDNLE